MLRSNPPRLEHHSRVRFYVALLIAGAFTISTSIACAQTYRTLEPVGLEQVTESRVALVIGNAEYEHVSPLQNPVNDAEGIARVLRERGFTVVVGTDLTYQSMSDAVDAFVRELNTGSIALFFYAGHGVSVDGYNYLIPTDADIRRESQVRFRTLNTSEVLAGMEEKEARLSMLIMDACRDNPFRSWRSSSTSGWATLQGRGGSFIMYGTAPGRKADDNRRGVNGLFTTSLLRHMQESGLELSEVAKRVNRDVYDASNGRQVTWSSRSFPGDFYFTPPPGDDRVEQPPQAVTRNTDSESSSPRPKTTNPRPPIATNPKSTTTSSADDTSEKRTKPRRGSPIVEFVNGPDTLYVNQFGTFEAGLSNDRRVRTEGLQYTWNFGDGSTGSGLLTTHSFARPGTYTVTFTAQNERGATSKNLTVRVIPYR